MSVAVNVQPPVSQKSPPESGARGTRGGQRKEGILRSTFKALLVPRRAIPIALVVVPLTIIQDAYSREAFAVPIALLMCGSFLLVGPSLWRALFPIDRPIAAGALTRVVVYAGVGAAVVLSVGRGLPRLAGAGVTFMTTESSLAVCMALFWVGGWGLARDIDLEDNLRRARARAELLAREADHAQLFALKSHLDPHFLFNTLNAIAEWCRADGLVAERAILQLSSMLRTMMTGISTTTWPLAREIELVDALFALHAIRDPSLFTVERDVPDPVPPIGVPPMVLLPLVENAMKHGPLARNKGIVRFAITTSGDEREGAVHVEISNPGAYSGPRVGGSGLPIVEKRLRLAFGKRAKFTIERDGDRTKAQLVFPATGPSSLSRGPADSERPGGIERGNRKPSLR
jgi:two-component system, LytTR family, sensor histidine kinase AlgZ